MSPSFLAAAVAAVALLTAGVGAGLLARECARLPRIEVVPWLVAAAGLTIALAAQAVGYSRGFGPLTFRAVQMGAQLVAPLALAWGLAEVTGRSVPARFTARLLLAALAIVGGVITASDPLSAAPFSKAWPPAQVHYQVFPISLLLVVSVVSVLAAVTAAAVAGVRSRREPAWREAFVVASAGGGAAVLVQLLRLALPLDAAYAAVCLLASALAWFAGTRSDVRRLRLADDGSGTGGRAAYGDDTYGALYRRGATGGWYRDDTGYGEFGADTGYGEIGAGTGHGMRAADTGYGRGYGDDTGYGRDGTGYGDDTGYGRLRSHDVSDTGYGFYREDTGGLRAVSDTGYGLYRDDSGEMVLADGHGPGGRLAPEDSGVLGTGAGEDDGSTSDLYGQIAIFTLLDSRAEEFDQLARDVVAKVRDREPDTMVFVMHTVPSAPMQRILYEVYRDQAAYDRHNDQPYMRDFEERRKPCVLATNVIELGVRQAKVAPLVPGEASRSGPQPAERTPARSPLDGRSRTRTSPQPGQSRPSPQPGQPRTGQAPAKSRGTADVPGESGFWTRAPGDEPDDGDFWTRGSRYR
jgi:quinol monooxygenase YgiN